MPLAAVAREFDVSAMTIKRWCDAHTKALAAGDTGAQQAAKTYAGTLPHSEFAAVLQEARELQDSLPEPPGLDGEPDSELEALDAITLTRRLLAHTRDMARTAETNGNITIAQKCNRDAAGLVVTLARLEKLHKSDADVLRLSKEDIEAAFEGIMQKATALLERPLLCSACNRQLSVQLAGKGSG
jgi:hypothetical protein